MNILMKNKLHSTGKEGQKEIERQGTAIGVSAAAPVEPETEIEIEMDDDTDLPIAETYLFDEIEKIQTLS